MSFVDSYGPWAIVAGASEGTGRAFARQLAAKGIPSLLVARREAPLKALADEIRKESNVACEIACIDLSMPTACKQIVAAVGAREVGLLVYNAGADANGSRFLDRDVSAWLELAGRNVTTTIQCCHHFGALMRARKRGGLLIVNSGAAYSGASFLGTYAGSKAFQLCFSEGLWAELRPHGVDVLTLMMSTTDTPALRALLAKKGLPVPPAASADEVAEVGLANLANGPVYDWGQDSSPNAQTPAAKRRERVLMIDQGTKRIFGD